MLALQGRGEAKVARYGSLINAVSDRVGPEPQVGDGATALYWSDRAPATVVEVVRFKTGQKAGQVKGVVVQWDKATRTDSNGMSDAQSYEYERDPDSPRVTFLKRKDGRFRNKGGTTLAVGFREKYYDYSF